MIMKNFTTLLILVAVGVLGNEARGTVITPTGVLASSEEAAFGRLAVNTINGSGLSGLGGPGSTHNNNASDMWMADTGGTGVNMDPAPTLTYDLGFIWNVKRVRVWNYNESGPFPVFGIKDVEILAGPNLASLVSHGTFTFTIADASNTTPAQDIAVDMPGVRFVKLNILSQHQDQLFPPGDFNVGLSEIRFDTIPEPSTAGLLALTLVMATAIRRRVR